MDKFIIKNSVIVEPQYLDANLHTYLNKKVKEDFVGKCFKDYGYIVDVIKILDFKSRITSSDSINVFDLEFEICSLFPKVGNKYKTVSFINAFSYDKFKGSFFNLYEIDKNGEAGATEAGNTSGAADFVGTKRSIQIFVTNGEKQKDLLSFSDCKCVINCDKTNSPFEMDVIIEYVKYKEGQFCIIGKHVH